MAFPNRRRRRNESSTLLAAIARCAWQPRFGRLDAAWRALFGGGLAAQRAVRPVRVSVPVVCIGNLIAGGAGKTPTALAVADRLSRKGLRPHLILRGYKGHARGPALVDALGHDAATVGDEALLLARRYPTWVARDRVAGARAAIAAGAEVIIMDDGFQNPSLVKDVSLIVVDGGYGFGNGRMIPAGPLREPLARGLSRAQAVVVVGNDTTDITQAVAPPGCRSCGRLSCLGRRPRASRASAYSPLPALPAGEILRHAGRNRLHRGQPPWFSRSSRFSPA